LSTDRPTYPIAYVMWRSSDQSPVLSNDDRDVAGYVIVAFQCETNGVWRNG